jgi:polyisoprenoid-binding protein YceI
MTRRIFTIVLIVGAVGLLAAGALAANVLRPPATPSGVITAIPVSAASDTPVPVAEATATSEPVAEAASSALITAEIVQVESEVRFKIDEILNGNQFQVVGVTDQVAGQILIDPSNPANVQMGPVTVNARTFLTDSGNRNRAIQNVILDTAQFEFVTFTPKRFVGLPAAGAVGDTFSFQIVGDLTVRDVTHEVTFDVTVTIESGTRLRGLASAVISREQFGLGLIQLPPQVASVSDPVTLEIDFVAEAVQ